MGIKTCILQSLTRKINQEPHLFVCKKYTIVSRKDSRTQHDVIRYGFGMD